MADIFVKESPSFIKYKPLITTSTPHKNINDSGYNTQSSTISSNASSNLDLISEVSISFNRTSPDLEILQLSSSSHNFTLDHNRRKLENITNTNNPKVSISSSSICEEELSPSKKCKLSPPDMRLHYRINNCSKDDKDSRLLKKKIVIAHQNVNHGRISVEGREYVDFMYFLAERHHFEPVTEKIFSYLSGNDIISMSMVSKIWGNVVQKSPTAQKKKRMYFKLSKENRSRCDGRDRSTFINKGCLANIGNVMRSPSKRDVPQRSPPVSPSKYRFHVFQKEAKKLSSDQQLVPCPRCTRPASWSPSQSTRAECKGYHCKFVFCTNCMCEYSSNFEHECLSIPILSMSSYSSSRRSTMSNLSKRKHNLRRL